MQTEEEIEGSFAQLAVFFGFLSVFSPVALMQVDGNESEVAGHLGGPVWPGL